jgi:hypothetical protein
MPSTPVKTKLIAIIATLQQDQVRQPEYLQEIYV